MGFQVGKLSLAVSIWLIWSNVVGSVSFTPFYRSGSFVGLLTKALSAVGMTLDSLLSAVSNFGAPEMSTDALT